MYTELKTETRPYAPESPQIQKNRNKLLAQLEKEQKETTPERIEKVKKTMYAEIHRNDRETVSKESLQLFAEGEGVKEISSRVQILRKEVFKKYFS